MAEEDDQFGWPDVLRDNYSYIEIFEFGNELWLEKRKKEIRYNVIYLKRCKIY